MKEQPESISIGEVGETIRRIVDCQLSPECPEVAIAALEESQQRLNPAWCTDISFGAKVTDLLVDCKAAVCGASEALTTARDQLTDYLDRIGAGAQNRDELVSVGSVGVTDETAYFQERPGPIDPHCAVDEDGTIRPRDPVNGEVMQPGEIPSSLRDNEELKTGFEFWQRHGPDVFLSLLFIKHASDDSLAESAIDLRAEARRLRQTGGVLFIEGVSS